VLQDLGGGHQCVRAGRLLRRDYTADHRFGRPSEEKEVKFVTPRNKAAWVADPNAIPLNASFRRPSPIEKSASLKKRNKALLYNQELGIVSKGVDMAERFVSSDEWETRPTKTRARQKGDEEAELRRLFGDRITPSGKAIFDDVVDESELDTAAAAEEEAPTGEEHTADESEVPPTESKP
jgi:hypothetical protein